MSKYASEKKKKTKTIKLAKKKGKIRRKLKKIFCGLFCNTIFNKFVKLLKTFF